MWKQKIGVSLGNNYIIPTPEVVKLVAKIGFDAISPVWEADASLQKIVEAAREENLVISSLHAPTNDTQQMWSTDTRIAGEALDSLLISLADCERFHIPVMVVHVWKGFEEVPEPTVEGLENFGRLVNQAKNKGIQIAFENTEGVELLYAIMDYFQNVDSVGFCWDSGHEMCYNYSEDLLAKFGDRLIMTHLNDNLGIKDFGGKIFWHDDLHLLPYDGIADWDYNVARLKKARKLDVLNFELKIESKPGRHENDCYGQMSLEQYFTEAYKRACKIADRYRRMFYDRY